MAGAESWNERPSLCEVLDRVLHKGVVAAGEVVITLADIELVWIGLNLTVASVDTARQLKLTLAPAPAPVPVPMPMPMPMPGSLRVSVSPSAADSP